MKLLSRLWTGTGVAATIATLLLSLPGPQIVRAEDAPALAEAVVSDLAGKTCEVAPVTPPVSVVLPAPSSGHSQVIVLNGAGYNYGFAPSMMPIVRPAPPADSR